MAIGPQLLNENFLKEAECFEKKIDSLLSTSKLSPTSSINLDVPSGMLSTHFQILKERYLNAGWKDVVWNSDQREGQWLTFKS